MFIIQWILSFFKKDIWEVDFKVDGFTAVVFLSKGGKVVKTDLESVYLLSHNDKYYVDLFDPSQENSTNRYSIRCCAYIELSNLSSEIKFLKLQDVIANQMLLLTRLGFEEEEVIVPDVPYEN